MVLAMDTTSKTLTSTLVVDSKYIVNGCYSCWLVTFFSFFVFLFTLCAQKIIIYKILNSPIFVCQVLKKKKNEPPVEDRPPRPRPELLLTVAYVSRRNITHARTHAQQQRDEAFCRHSIRGHDFIFLVIASLPFSSPSVRVSVPLHSKPCHYKSLPC